MPLSNLLSPSMLLLAFSGGAFGAAIGALPAFSFTGFAVMIGESVKIARRALETDTTLAVDITNKLAFGVFLGPHVSFGGGAAAVAYAAKKGYVGEFDYHPAKKITVGLGSKPDVLAVGGVFGVLGYAVTTVSSSLSAPWDPVAFGVVVSAICHRLVFGYTVVGGLRKDLLGASSDDGAETWLPYQSELRGVTVLGLTVGALGGYVAYVTQSAFLAFGISAATLVFINAGVRRVPVTHHITLPASTAVLAAGVTSNLAAVVVVGALFGALGSVAGELLQRLLYAHSETHLDPPAASIVVTSFVIAVLGLAGVFKGFVWIPHP